MLIKITEKCSMGCSHCMNRASTNGKHMDFDTFKKVISFQEKYGGSFCILSGGEPTEHPDFENYIIYALSNYTGFITVATNGVWMQTHYDFVKYLYDNYNKNIMWQVSTVDEYYPIKIDTSLPVFQIPNVIVCTKIEHIYPMGRALDNNLQWESKASKCTNIRLIMKQLQIKRLDLAIGMMAIKGFFCTPQISIYGEIKLGESDLCPVCSHIDKSMEEISNDILNFHCHNCDHINKNRASICNEILGE